MVRIIPTIESIPDKRYFKIGEVCDLTGLKTHTLRYWESEFAIIKPKRAGSHQRLYRKIDVENILLIKKLIQEDGLTLAGIRKYLAKQKGGEKKSALEAKTPNCFDLLLGIKKELIDIKRIVE